MCFCSSIFRVGALRNRSVYNEIGNDVMLAAKKECPLWQASETEKAEYLRRIQPYDYQLPTYHDIAMQLLEPQE